MNTNVTIALRLPENAAALTCLNNRRQALLTLILDRDGMANVPAGTPDGSGHLQAALTELNLTMAQLIHTDLVEGRRF